MRCEEIEERLVSYVLGESGDDEAREVRKHLETCGRCSALAEEYRRTISALGRWRVPSHGRIPDFNLLPAPPVPGTAPGSGRKTRWYLARLAAGVSIAAMVVALFLVRIYIRVGGGSVTIEFGRIAERQINLREDESVLFNKRWTRTS